MTAEFGAPAPLPGQRGFGAKPSESMARETAEMEERLARLKTDLAAEAEMREAAGPRKGGARWRSARTDRGSVRAYAKDVKIRHKQQLQHRPPHGIFANGGKASTDRCAPAARPSLESKEVSQWGVADTLEWLDSLGLGKHKDVFQQNEISGPILLEVGLDDLDYMSVRVLAHRKRLLKGIEDLRRGGKSINPDKPPPPAPTPILVRRRSSSSESIDRERRTEQATTAVITASAQRCHENIRGDHASLSPGRRKQHWSTIKPLADEQTEERGYNSSPLPANLADGQYDEVAAHSDFADAVAEWRGARKTSSTIETADTTAKTSVTQGATSSLHRPTVICRAPLAGMLDGTQEGGESSGLLGKNTTRIGKGLLGGQGGDNKGRAGECWTNPFASPRPGKLVPASEGAPLLGDRAEPDDRKMRSRARRCNDFPALEEEAEHEAFQRAVADWNRSGRATAPDIPHSCEGGVLDQIDSRSCAETATVGVALPSRRTVEAMADELREQMDAEHRLQAKDLEEQKKALLMGFEPSRHDRHGIDGECRGNTIEQNTVCKEEQEFGESEGASCHDDLVDPNTGSSSTSSSASLPAPTSSRESKDAEVWSGGWDHASSRPAVVGAGAKIEVIESVLGANLSIERGTKYLVDEYGSGDELKL
ncbi:unnamed protein product [Scytosiphon promiscuus]